MQVDDSAIFIYLPDNTTVSALYELPVTSTKWLPALAKQHQTTPSYEIQTYDA
jgi:hypothetical protein